MLASTIREHFAEKFPGGIEDVPHEQIPWAIQDWFSSHGMEIVEDDRKFLDEIGEDADDYMQFDDDQVRRIEEIYGLAEELCRLMITPLPGRPPESYKQALLDQHYLELADTIADALHEDGYKVYFPTHHHNADGTEFISDMWER